MDIIPLEYVYYCCGALTILTLTGLIKNFYNIKDISTLELMEQTKPNTMKKTQSMNIIMEQPVFLKIGADLNHIERNCLERIPKENKYINLWLNSILSKKGTCQCASPNCVKTLNKGGMIFMAFDSKFCSDRCRTQAQNYIGKYWNINK